MSFSVPSYIDGPESLEDIIEVPGFPRASTKVDTPGYAASLQGHLEKLSANAKSIHHVLEALCGGLDKLDKKIDTNSTQMEARLANIVHHMTGEADEDTMSAWGSLEGVGSPADLSRRRNSFGLQMTSFSEGPFEDVDDSRSTGLSQLVSKVTAEETAILGKKVGTGIFEGTVGRETVQVDEDMGAGDIAGEDTTAAGGIQPEDAVIAADNEDDEPPVAVRAPATVVAAAEPSIANAEGSGETARKEDKAAKQNLGEVENKSVKPKTDEVAKRNSRADEEALVEVPRQKTHPRPQLQLRSANYPRKSNQDDQTDGSSRGPHSAREDESFRSSDVESIHQTKQAEEEESQTLGMQASVTSGGSDARYVARQRWIWAFWRVCQLLRRKKRKQFEIMSQRATDRTVRMGSRVSVVEKRLDETQELLIGVDRLRDKTLVHTDDMKTLNRKVAELSALLGVEERVNGLVKDTQANIEGMVKSGDIGLEEKMKTGHEELETRLEGEMKRHGARLEDMDDRYARSEDAVRRAEEKIGDMQDEVTTVSNAIAELERQVRVDEERLDTLESLKKAHQQRLSELRVQEEGAPTGGVLLEPEETASERMVRLLKAAGTAAEFVATDLRKIIDKSDVTPSTSSIQANGARSRQGGVHDVMEQLLHISIEAEEYARRCSIDRWGADTDGGGEAAERAENLCARIGDTLSLGASSDVSVPPGAWREPSTAGAGREGNALGDVVCPNGRRDLRERLEAARDALLPVVGERTSVGGVKVTLSRMMADLTTKLERTATTEHLMYELQDLQGKTSDLDRAVGDIKDFIYDRGIGGDDGGVGARRGEGGGGVSDEALDERLAVKADVSWVQHELQGLWNAIHSSTMATEATCGGGGNQATTSCHSTSSVSSKNRKENPETAGEESDVASPPPSREVRGVLSSLGTTGRAGAGGDALAGVDNQRRSSFTEGSSLVKDLLRKISRLEQQMASKADNDEVTRALSSVGVKLRKISVNLPAIEDSLSNKIEKKDLSKLAALITSGGRSEVPDGSSNGNDDPTSNSAVLASRLNSKFRCLSCDRPLPALGPPGPPKLGTTSVYVAGAGAPRSPQRIARAAAGGRLTPPEDLGPRPKCPSTTPTSSSRADTGDVAGWEGSSRLTPGDDIMSGSPGATNGSSSTKDPARRRPAPGSAGVASQEQPGRLEPLAAYLPGEHTNGVMSRYPRMMPPPSRVRTAAGGGGAGIGSRPGSSSGGWAGDRGRGAARS